MAALCDTTTSRILRLNHELKHALALENDIHPVTIVAVGDQSHGKSSVIEAISHVDLPRGEGMKTKVPLALHLRRLEDKTETEHALIGFEGQGVDDSEPDKKKTETSTRIELSEIPDQVDKLTAEIVGSGNVIKNVEITLTIFKFDLENLTLYDLPGLVRNVDDKETVESVNAIYDRYQPNPNAVLLNVVNATLDLETVDTLNRSREVDPDGRRTVVCLTKIDKENDRASLITKFEAASTKFSNIHRDCIFYVRNRT